MNYLRALIREVIKDEKNFTGAGIVVVKKEKDNLKFLGLRTKKGMDIPKGGADQDESPIETAKRETYEEASLADADLNFEWGKPSIKIGGRLFVFVASTKKTPSIGVNPKTGEKEHDGFSWLSYEDMMNNCQDFLQPAITWARDVIENEGKRD